MDFQTAVKSGLNNLTNFEGKATRSEYWWFVLAAVIIMIVLGLVLGSVLGSMGILVNALVGTGLMIAIGVRRIQDVGKPALWVYVYYGVYLGWTAMSMVMPGLVGIFGIVLLVMGLGLLYFFIQPSAGAAPAPAAEE